MIKSEKELLDIISEIQKDTPSTSLLLFRGQTQLHDKIRSGRARSTTITQKDVENGWNTIVNRLSKKTSETKHNQAILQHYGFPTYYIDLTSDPVIAAWFACNKYSLLKPQLWVGATIRVQDETTYEKITEGIGHLFVLEIPNFAEMIEKQELFDITHESVFKRPKSQSAYLMLDQPPRQPNPNNFIKHVLEIDRTKYVSSKNIKELFPNPKIDKGYEGLLNVPFVQIPSYYLEKNNKKLSDKGQLTDLDKYFTLAKRAIHIPLYVENKSDLFEFNPKWNDTVIFEPTPFQLWNFEKFNISDIHEGQNGIFGETSKITISPSAYEKLFNSEKSTELVWPLIDSNSIFFTKAELDHDKVINHSPPYVGVWLHKDNDLILEMHLFCNKEDKLELVLGHAFVLEDGKLTYVKVEKECDCGNGEEHLEIVSSLLKIHALIKTQEIALIQHTFGIEKWYVLI
mgnify:CR=1 FL=1